MAGAMFYDQAMAVTITLFVSYGVAIILLPVYYGVLYRRLPHFKPNAWLERFSFDRVESRYDSILKWFFRHRAVMWTIYAAAAAGLVTLFFVVGQERLPEMTYRDMLVRIDWNERISAEENARRTDAMISELGTAVEQSTVMAGVQQFILGHTDEMGVAEATVYLKCYDSDDVQSVQDRLSTYMMQHVPEAHVSFGVSGNIFDMIFADKEAMLTARLRSTSGRAATPEQLQGVIESISRALPEMHIPPIAVQEDIMYVAQPERMALYGVSYSMLFTALRNALNENTLFTINSGNESLPVVVGSNIDDLNDLLEKTFVKAGDAEIPVGVFMKQTRSLELKSIVAGEEGDYYPLELAPASRDVDRVMRTVRDCVAEAEGFEGDGASARMGSCNRPAVALFHPRGAVRVARAAAHNTLGDSDRPVRGNRHIVVFRADAQPDVDDRPDSGLRYCHQRLDSEDRHNKYPSASRHAYAACHT